MAETLEIPLFLLLAAAVSLGVILVLALGKIRKLQTELNVVAEHAPAAIAHVAKRGDQFRYEFVNSKYAALYGFTQKDVIGNRPISILGNEVFDLAKANMDRVVAGETIVFELPFKDRTLQVTYAPDKHAPGFIGIICDVTDVKKRAGMV